MRDLDRERKIVYAIAAAIKSKLKGVIHVSSIPLNKEATLYEFKYTTERGTTGVAYSNGYFENTEKSHLVWVATTTMQKLVQQQAWIPEKR